MFSNKAGYEKTGHRNKHRLVMSLWITKSCNKIDWSLTSWVVPPDSSSVSTVQVSFRCSCLTSLKKENNKMGEMPVSIVVT